MVLSPGMVIQGFLLLLLSLTTTTDTGTLQVISAPRTEVIWEDVSLGTTDQKGVLQVSDIPPGRFEIILHKPGFEEVRRFVVIEPNEASLLRVALQPLAAIAPENDPPPGNQSGAASRLLSDPEPAETISDDLPPAESPAEEPAAPVRTAYPPSAGSLDEESPPIWPLLLLPVLLMVLLVYLFRRWRAVPLISAPPTLLTDEDLLEPPDPAPKMTSFLKDLKKQEELLEQGVEMERPKKGPVIDLDADSVREIEDQ